MGEATCFHIFDNPLDLSFSKANQSRSEGYFQPGLCDQTRDGSVMNGYTTLT